jgi:hypothetical protein
VAIGLCERDTLYELAGPAEAGRYAEAPTDVSVLEEHGQNDGRERSEDFGD